MDGTKGIKDSFSLYGLGDGKTLFDDYAPASDLNESFAQSADPAARTGEYWKPAPEPVSPAVIDNFRDMIFGKDQ